MRKLIYVLPFLLLVGCASFDPAPFVDSLLAKLAVVAGYSGILGGVIEMLFRLIPSKEPLSLAYSVSVLFHGIGKVFESLADFLDKILPQKLK